MDKKYLLTAKEIAESSEFEFRHALNPPSERFMRSLSDPTGLERTGVMIVRVKGGEESFPFHRHYGEEEWVYVISGRGVLDVGEETMEIGAGDFMGFPAGSDGHQIK